AHGERRKRGFTVPVRRWMASLADDALLDACVPEVVTPWIDRDRARRLLLGSPRGRELAWPLLAFAHWARASEPDAVV
ncbi:MAG: hypothetical protein D6701_11780, partial [Gemmatimonadetes bacterium]